MSQHEHPPQEVSKQALLGQLPDPDTGSRQYTGNDRRHDDIDDIKRFFSGFGSIDWGATYTKTTAKGRNHAEAGGRKWRRELLPNVLKHSWDHAHPSLIEGGTDWLAIGPPGSGKSNTALWLAARLLEENGEKVIWRGSPSRSEWLPFCRWARVCLPEGVDVDVRFEPKNPTQEPVEVNLDDVVREVVRYRDPVHLNKELLQEGGFHVVYPDPKMRGLQDLYEDDDEKQYEDLEFTEDDPVNHWWFGYVHARIRRGPHHWTTLILDEIGDIAPEDARADEFATYQKIEFLKDCWVDARKKGLSLFAFGHSEEDIHSKIRRKIRWRVTMATKANPTSKGDVVGFDAVPMNQDIMSSRPVGEFLIWSESEFQYPPPNIGHFPDPVEYSLEVSYDN